MAKTATYWDEKPFETNEKYREYPERAKGVSFFVFVLSVLVYMSIFYTCNLSPSNFVNDNKFWFFISNTLILIIAADYGAFCSSKNKHDLHEEYVMRRHMHMHMHTQAKCTVPASFVSQHPETVDKASTDHKAITTINTHEEEEEEEVQETEEKVLEIVVRSEPAEEEEKTKKKRRVVIDESKKIETEQEETTTDYGSCVEENDEFSSMSNEELNRRVEDFIKRFNRQIRLQRAGNFH